MQNKRSVPNLRKQFPEQKMCAAFLVFLPPGRQADLTCDAILAAAADSSLSGQWLESSSWNETQSNGSVAQSSGSVAPSVADAYCEASLDGIGTCWPRSPAAHVVSRPCPEMFYGVRYNTTNSVYRKCLSNGTWAPKGNYSMCKAILHQEAKKKELMPLSGPRPKWLTSTPCACWPFQKKGKMHYQMAVIINFLGHVISMLALLVAFFLFLCLRSIRCLRNIIHWNLISAFILRNATWFVVQLTMSPEVHESNVVWCRLVTACFNYFHSTNFFWMFGEGCYLHTAIVLTYSTDKLRKWMFICIGWCIPFPIIVAWAIGKLYYDNEKCWFGKRAGVYTDYIYQGPMILVLVINFIFLFNIVRILMTKLRASTTSETIQYRKAVKATLVLLPLLGITYMLFFVNPGEDEISQLVFIYFNSFLESFQGFFVSVFYCFLNSEVRSAARKRFRRWQEQHSIRARMTQAVSVPTSPSRVSFHSIKQSTSL
ncbi:corticotropin-releasing factor receptor 1 isoform X3 [Syngnathus scovelli]|uniref:corticotropin-releasing factor receptor 1 isoform X3 n=1 Tax=Syngnathus scovelli TaxID=161590 RepID=UPI0021105625|nr:corticotropin-releasing factor receptor 1 isoform X3 [Syngnathus scovelli]XP_049615826.1 corticotropin-releasing factor receptor 1 isoform X3 [Syngnathus scovelli]